MGVGVRQDALYSLIPQGSRNKGFQLGNVTKLRRKIKKKLGRSPRSLKWGELFFIPEEGFAAPLTCLTGIHFS